MFSICKHIFMITDFHFLSIAEMFTWVTVRAQIKNTFYKFLPLKNTLSFFCRKACDCSFFRLLNLICHCLSLYLYRDQVSVPLVFGTNRVAEWMFLNSCWSILGKSERKTWVFPIPSFLLQGVKRHLISGHLIMCVSFSGCVSLGTLRLITP